MSVVPQQLLAPGYAIPRLIKGGWQLAGGHGPVDRRSAIADMMAFAEAGITAFDCADIYTGVEELIGEFLRAWRERHGPNAPPVRVHTKCVPDRDLLPVLTFAHLEALIDRSLRRLGVDTLDLVQFHWWDYDVPGCVQALLWLQELQQAGKVAHIGTTNFDVAHMREIVGAGVKLLSNQLQYSIMDLRPENGMVDFCREHGIHLLCYGTIAGGFLSDKWLGQADPPQPYANRSLVKYRLIVEEFGGWDLYQALLAEMAAIARKHDSNIAAVAARYVLDKPQVAAALVGAKNAAHLDETLDIFRLELDASDTARLEALARAAPGPAGDCYTLERDKDSVHAKIMQMNQNTHGAPAKVEMSPRLETLRG